MIGLVLEANRRVDHLNVAGRHAGAEVHDASYEVVCFHTVGLTAASSWLGLGKSVGK
jgi:hypothetical protein